MISRQPPPPQHFGHLFVSPFPAAAPLAESGTQGAEPSATAPRSPMSPRPPSPSNHTCARPKPQWFPYPCGVPPSLRCLVLALSVPRQTSPCPPARFLPLTHSQHLAYPRPLRATSCSYITRPHLWYMSLWKYFLSRGCVLYFFCVLVGIPFRGQ